MNKYFDDSIKKIHGHSMSLPGNIPDPDSMSLLAIDDDNVYSVKIPDDNPVDATGKEIYKNSFTDTLTC